MSILALTAAAAAAPAGENPYGLFQALQQGGIIAWSVFIILVGMSIFSFYILFTKLMQQQKIISQGRKVRASFWNSPNLLEAATKLESRSAYRAIVDDALVMVWPSLRPSARPPRSSVCSAPSSASTAPSSRSARQVRRRSTWWRARSVRR